MDDVLPFEDLISLIHEHAQIALDNPYKFKNPIKNVAVIGAGPYGLCSARFLKEVGMEVKVFERCSYIGGTWKYTDEAPPKPSIPTKPKKTVNVDHVPQNGNTVTFKTEDVSQTLLEEKPPSACYRDLMVNVHSKYFSFPDFPFPPGASDYPKHHEMLAYFQRYADYFELMPLIKLDTRVEKVIKSQNEWELVLCNYEITPNGLKETRWREKFDAVVAASGLHQEPFIPNVKGLAEYDAKWPDKVIHSKQIRRAEDFMNKNVVIVGAGVSGIDSSRYLNGFAKTMTIVNRGPWVTSNPVINGMREKIPKYAVIKPEIESFASPDGDLDGSITFKDGTHLKDVDSIIFCTGYSHSLSYLDQIEENSNHVSESHVVLGREYALNTFYEVFLISDPTFCFIAMPHIFSITPYFYTQAIAIARVLSGQAYVPDSENMAKIASSFKPALPSDSRAAYRRRREVYVSFLNYQAQKFNLDLPKVNNYHIGYEEEGKQKNLPSWEEQTDANFKQVREKNIQN